MTRKEFDKAEAKYRRTYDALYIASARSNSDAESDAIDAKLVKANIEWRDAKAEFYRGITWCPPTAKEAS